MQKYIITILYTLLFLPLAVLRTIYKAITNPLYRTRINERFAVFNWDRKISIDIWIHTVSVGEFLAAKILLDKIITLRPELNILITTTTPTGSQLVLDYIKNKDNINIKHLYFPYDVKFICQSFISKIKPKMAVFFETEIWPKMFGVIKNNNIKLFIINARISDKSYQGYTRIKDYIKNILSKVDYIAAQTETDKTRLLSLGVSKNNISVYGNIKYNLQLPEDITEQSNIYKKFLIKNNQNKKILIAASTHPGEEEIILDIYNNIRQHDNNLLLILVPRHPERSMQVAKLCELCSDYKYHIVKYSELFDRNHANSAVDSTNLERDPDIFILDTIGKLLYFYNLSDLAFIGGSMVDIGGHNPIEPALLDIPSIIGPYYSNFTDIVNNLQKNKGILVAHDKKDLENAIMKLLTDKNSSEKLARSAKESLKTHQLVLEQYIELLLNTEHIKNYGKI